MIELKATEALIPQNLIANLDEKRLTQFVRNLAAAAYDKWINLAKQDPSSFQQDYLKGIQKPQVTRGTAVIALVGSVANMLEHGAPTQDLRDILLGSGVPTAPRGARGKHEAKAGGYYRAIPFRHATPGATGQVVGQEMGSAYSGQADYKKLGRDVYGAAKQLKAYQDPYAAPKERRLKEGLAPKLRDHHKTDIYAGMIREEKTYEKATQGQYFTFRTISTHVTDKDGNRKPASEGWIRKPIMARKYAEQVAAFVQKIAPDALSAMLEGE